MIKCWVFDPCVLRASSYLEIIRIMWMTRNECITLRGPMTCQQWLLTPFEWSALLLVPWSTDKGPFIPSGLLLWLSAVSKSHFLSICSNFSCLCGGQSEWSWWFHAFCRVVVPVAGNTIVCKTNLIMLSPFHYVISTVTTVKKLVHFNVLPLHVNFVFY